MQKTFRAGVVLSLSLLMLFSAPWLCAQGSDAGKPADKGAPEQKTVEKSPTHSFGERCELTTCVTKVLYFSNITQPTDLQDVVNTLRAIVEIARVQQVLSAQLLVVRATPEQMALAEKLADEIDKAKRRFGAVGYRLDFKVTESEADKKPRSRIYSLVTEAHDAARLSIGRQSPAQSQSEAASDSKQSPDAVSGRSIECRILSESERTVELNVELAFSSSGAKEPGTREAGEDEKAGLNGRGSPRPAQVRVKDYVTVELGKPTVISVLDDPDNERTFQIEVTATRIKEKP
jgi:hypothetical protein